MLTVDLIYGNSSNSIPSLINQVIQTTDDEFYTINNNFIIKEVEFSNEVGL